MRERDFDPGLIEREFPLLEVLVLQRVLLGLVGGLLLGAILAVAVLEALAVSATATNPEPSLVLAPDWIALVLGLVLFAVAAGVVIAVLARSGFREQVPSVETA